MPQNTSSRAKFMPPSCEVWYCEVASRGTQLWKQVYLNNLVESILPRTLLGSFSVDCYSYHNQSALYYHQTVFLGTLSSKFQKPSKYKLCCSLSSFQDWKEDDTLSKIERKCSVILATVPWPSGVETIRKLSRKMFAAELISDVSHSKFSLGSEILQVFKSRGTLQWGGG